MSWIKYFHHKMTADSGGSNAMTLGPTTFFVFGNPTQRPLVAFPSNVALWSFSKTTLIRPLAVLVKHSDKPSFWIPVPWTRIKFHLASDSNATLFTSDVGPGVERISETSGNWSVCNNSLRHSCSLGLGRSCSRHWCCCSLGFCWSCSLWRCSFGLWRCFGLGLAGD